MDINIKFEISLSDDMKSFVSKLFGTVPAAPKAPTAPPPAPAPKAPTTSDDDVTIEDLRKALAPKVEANRELIRSTLLKLGVENLSKLKKENYKEIFDFLNSL